MKKVMSKLMLSCKKATELIEKKHITPLRPMERIQLGLHKKMCKVCSAYEKQSDFIEKALDNQFQFKAESQEDKLSDEAKKRMIDRLVSGNKN